MRSPRVCSLLVCLVLSVVPLGAQSTSTQTASIPPTRDPQAISTLTQYLNNSGGSGAIGSIQDFTGTGNITYFWAGSEVQGTVTVRGIGTTGFRLDAVLPAGSRSWFTYQGQGAVKEVTGTISPISARNGINLTAQIVPSAAIYAALTDTTYGISPSNPTTFNGSPAFVVQIQKTFSVTDDPTGDMTKWGVKSFVFDAQSGVLLETLDTAHPDVGPDRDWKHEILFSGYQQVGGLTVPFAITEKIEGQQTWSIQLQSMTFNTGLTSQVFQF